MLLPVIGRLTLLQTRNQNLQMPLLVEVFAYLGRNCLQLLEAEYQLNISAAYYEAKLRASEVNNCRTLLLPSMVVYIAQKKLIKPAEINCMDYQFEKILETWRIDVSLREQRWYQRVTGLLEEEHGVQDPAEWYWRVEQLQAEVLE